MVRIGVLRDEKELWIVHEHRLTKRCLIEPGESHESERLGKSIIFIIIDIPYSG